MNSLQNSLVNFLMKRKGLSNSTVNVGRSVYFSESTTTSSENILPMLGICNLMRIDSVHMEQIFNALNSLELKSLEEPIYLFGQFFQKPLECLTLGNY